MTNQAGLVIENLSKTFHTKHKSIQALSGINLTVGKGEFVNIIGPSGCGKSTLALHCRLRKPTEGRLLLNGQKAPNQESIA